MNVSDSMTPAEFEPEPDSPVPIPCALHWKGTHYRMIVNNVNSVDCSDISRNGDARRPTQRLEVVGNGALEGTDPRRNSVTGTR
jgi:hypothetical protein